MNRIISFETTQHKSSRGSRGLTAVGYLTFGEEREIDDTLRINEVYGQHYPATALPRILGDNAYLDTVSVNTCCSKKEAPAGFSERAVS